MCLLLCYEMFYIVDDVFNMWNIFYNVICCVNCLIEVINEKKVIDVMEV